MNPYERTAQEMKRQSEGPKRFGQGAITIGSTALGVSSFANTLSRVAPLLSQYIPEEMAIKGLTKLNPKLGSFVQNALSKGFGFDQVKEFIGDQIKDAKKSSLIKNPEKLRSQFSNFFGFLDHQIGKGLNPDQAADLAWQAGYEKDIKKIEKETNLHLANILDYFYPQKNKPQEQPNQMEQNQPQPQQQPTQSPMAQQAPQPQQMQPQGQGPGQQANTDQALMAALEKILKM